MRALRVLLLIILYTGRIWNLIVSVPDHGLVFTLVKHRTLCPIFKTFHAME